MSYPALNFPPIHLRARRGDGGRIEVFDHVRGKWLVLTPEEWVRRHVVEYLRSECGYQPQQIAEEYPVDLNGMAQRADIVAFDNDLKPHLVVECKEPNVKIDNDVLSQVVRYNSVLRCRYVVITNGLTTHCFEHCDNGEYSSLDHFPQREKR